MLLSFRAREEVLRVRVRSIPYGDAGDIDSLCVKGETDTGFVARHKLDLAPKELSTKKRRMLLAAAALSNRDFRERVEAVPEPYASIGDWSN